ncbi:50S ribosomal protein L10 [Tannockella kyphosi]|uniref:50S ribosomal protein L10 n=1 Tax=Tannockella kyphosi TaxID=2899121 RepID=UPI002012779B|nr:50S ribosomal protein L10 [Tannockella kyphosi]
MSVEAISLKAEVVTEIAEKFNNSHSAVVVEYRGLSVADVTVLRRELRAEGVEFKVYKNKLMQRAAEQVGYEALNDQLVGPNAIAFGNDDAVAPARILANFAKDHEALIIKAGVMEGKVLSSDEVKEISSLPGRDGMYSMLLAMMKEPVAKVARVINAVAENKPADGTVVETTEEAA